MKSDIRFCVLYIYVNFVLNIRSFKGRRLFSAGVIRFVFIFDKFCKKDVDIVSKLFYTVLWSKTVLCSRKDFDKYGKGS